MNFDLEFSNYLKEEGIISEKELIESLKVSKDTLTPLYQVLVKNKALDERTVYQKLAEFLHLEYRFFQMTEVDLKLYQEFSREKMLEYRVMPVFDDENSVTFAISNPFKIEELKEFTFSTNKQIKYYLVNPTQMEHLIRYADNKILQKDVLSDFTSKDEVSEDDENNVTIEAPIIRLCDSILKDAVNRGASDIHIEPFEKNVHIRFRIDGKLSIIDTVDISYYQSILARYKIMAEMNIAERRIPQDGKINMELSGSKYDFRVSTIPTIFGEKIVIRIFDVGLKSSSITNLGFHGSQQELVKNMLERPYGIILLTGPTGSGKSTSLYTFLRYLNKPDTNIITVEDPVENQIEGISQVQVNPKANLTFAAALRSILRQDPNVIMIGEIRDEETAQIATRAAITGHLVLSTIHTNNACGVVSRLINMGIPNYLVADSLLGAISQRLVRKLCPDCKKEHITTPSEMKMLGIDKAVTIYEPCGCKACNNTGYNGRIGVFEILTTNDEVKEEMMNPKFTSEGLNKVAKIKSLMDDAKERVLSGETSISEYSDLNEIISRQGE